MGISRGVAPPPHLTAGPPVLVWLCYTEADATKRRVEGRGCLISARQEEGLRDSAAVSQHPWITLIIFCDSSVFSFLSFFKEERNQNRKEAILRMSLGCHSTRLIWGQRKAYLLLLHPGCTASAFKRHGWWSPMDSKIKAPNPGAGPGESLSLWVRDADLQSHSDILYPKSLPRCYCKLLTAWKEKFSDVKCWT